MVEQTKCIDQKTVERYKKGQISYGEFVEILRHCGNCFDCNIMMKKIDLEIIQTTLQLGIPRQNRKNTKFCPARRDIIRHNLGLLTDDRDVFLGLYIAYHVYVCPKCFALNEKCSPRDVERILQEFEKGIVFGKRYSEEWCQAVFGESLDTLKEIFGLLPEESLYTFFSKLHKGNKKVKKKTKTNYINR
jgi:hypothetical protein